LTILFIVAETIHVKKEKLSVFSSILESLTSKFISNELKLLISYIEIIFADLFLAY
jgi:hypothetical protein